ncbi:MaoC family dehydratase N-terminal domain-containing protein [Porticoccaceae bacterium]|nr:MaoC family dehydratase N-terminal domain-containing protein [Porticoccaceae bacterium]
MLDKSKIGHQFDSFTTLVELGKLRFFAKATGETNPLYSNTEVAQAAGYAAVPIPPTYVFSLDLDSEELMPVVSVLGLDVGRVLHGAQEFEYFAPICVGDEITVTSTIKDIYDKKNGALDFVILENTYTNQQGVLAATTTSTLVQRS